MRQPEFENLIFALLSGLARAFRCKQAPAWDPNIAQKIKYLPCRSASGPRADLYRDRLQCHSAPVNEPDPVQAYGLQFGVSACITRGMDDTDSAMIGSWIAELRAVEERIRGTHSLLPDLSRRSLVGEGRPPHQRRYMVLHG
jgi:hypothetical protein